MATSPTAYAANTQPIHPESIYPYAAYIRCSGITKTRIREARLQGIVLKTINAGRRKYVRGVDGIAFIEAISRL
jgi:hypothetical protein